MNERRGFAGRWLAVFALDVRSLAAFRIALGALLLADLATRAGDFAAMYDPGGLAPVELVRSRLGPGDWSLHLLSGGAGWQAALFAAAAALAVMLMLGYRTRLATIGSFVLLASLHVRLPIVLNAGDTLLRVLLFWSMFLPLGAAWSLDARRRGPWPTTRVPSAATVALVVQLALVYWCAGIAKLNASWLSGDALEQVLSFGLYSRPWGQWLRQFPLATRWLSWGVVALELAGPCLLFLPWRTARLRVLAIAAFIAFHLGIEATITLGLFSWVGIAAWLVVIPSGVWDRLRTSPSLPADGGHAAPVSLEGSAWSRAVVFALLALVIAWNALDLFGFDSAPRLAAALRPIGNATMLRQSWVLFSEPSVFDVWFVYRGRLRNGAVVDLLRGTPAAEGDERSPAAQQFANHRWRKLHLRVALDRFAAYRQPLANFVCRAWNERHGEDEQAMRLDFYCIRRPVDPGAESDAFIRVNLARVVLDPSEGNFADALRELED